jgi:hypothetical protein
MSSVMRHRALRSSGAARLAMLLAALLAAGSSFGLHPEPGSARDDGAPALECTHSPTAAPEAHDCVACRAHRPIVAAASLAVAPALPLSTPRVPLSGPQFSSPFESGGPDGRAPPDAS